MKTGFFTFWTGVLLVIIITGLSGSIQSQTPQYVYTGTGSLIGNVSPFGTTGNTRKMWVFTPSNFTPAAPAGYITAAYFKVSASPTSSTFTNLLVQMGTTTLSSFTAGPYPGTIDTVFFAASHTVNIISSGPWLKISFQTPFYFNGTSNFLVDVQQGGYTSAITIQQQTVTGTCIYGPAATSTGTIADRLVEFGFDMIPGGTDVGLEGFVAPADTVCAGILPVIVTMKNYGPNQLSGATINWMADNVAQPAFNWTGNLAVNATTSVTAGNYPFSQSVSNSLKVWVSNPNNATDTVHSNDTIFKAGVYARPAPQINLFDTSLAICQGDSAAISGQLSGTPPWTLILSDGTSNTTYSNLSVSSFNIHVGPSVTKTYTFSSIADASGCVNTSGPHVKVTVLPAPGATITPVGATAACEGDSVSLMATIGLNFTYQWYKNGISVSGMTGYASYIKTSGDYTVKVTTSYLCSSISAPVTVVIHPLPVVFLGNDTNVAPGAFILLDAGPGFNSYLWSTGAGTQTLKVDTAGHGTGVRIIWVEVRDNNYCKGTDSIRINFVSNPGIADIFSEASLKIIPNPTSGKFELQMHGIFYDDCLLGLFSADGRLVFSQMIDNNTEQAMMTIDPGHLPAGLYLLRLTDSSGKVLGCERLQIRQL
jgi:hypothetical protein